MPCERLSASEDGQSPSAHSFFGAGDVGGSVGREVEGVFAPLSEELTDVEDFGGVFCFSVELTGAGDVG